MCTPATVEPLSDYTPGSSSLHLYHTAAQDCSRPALGENMDLKGDDVLKQSFPDGTTVRLACNIGYSAAGGSTAITCSAGTWSRVSLRCESEYQVLHPAHLFPTASDAHLCCSWFPQMYSVEGSRISAKLLDWISSFE